MQARGLRHVGILRSLKRLVALTLLAPGLCAHVVSMSSSEIVVNGTSAAFELRMPMYEVAHVSQPQTALLDQVHFSGGRLKSSSCRQEDASTYVCHAQYEFEKPLPDKLETECTLFKVTVPNHVHLMHATQGP